MRLSDIIVRTQRQFGDDVQAQITKEDIVRWVNDACLEIVTKNDTSEGMIANTSVLSGTSVYNLPPDIIRIRSVRVNGYKMQPTTYEQLTETDPNLETATGTPTQYWVYGGKLNLYPCPNEDLGKISVLYIKTPDILTVDMLDREPDVPTQYHPRIVEYCVAQAAELDDNLGHYQVKMQQFTQNVQNLNQNSEQPETQGVYPSITYVEEY